MYELYTAVWTLVTLGQNMIGLVAEETPAVGTHIIVLELTAEFLSLLGNLGRVPVSFDEENNRG